MEDAELLEIAKKNRSVLNMQTLEKLAIKTILKNFDKFPTTALESLACPQKTAFLEFLLELTKQKKNIPLSLNQRLNLIKSLLHKELERFDFSLINSPRILDYGLNDLMAAWHTVYDYLWTELAPKCPNLKHIKERRPVFYDHRNPLNTVKLNRQALKFSKLMCLETNTTIDSDLMSAVCQNLKELRRLEVNYENVSLVNVEELNSLEKLQELLLPHLKMPGGQEFPYGEVQEFCENFFRLFPKLKSCMSYDFDNDVPRVQVNDLNNQEIYALEQCEVRFRSNDNVSKLAECMPNLRHIALENFVWDDPEPHLILETQLMQKFSNLSSLIIGFCDQTLKILTAVGPQLKLLEINFSHRTDPVMNPFNDLLKIFMLCPILESLYVSGFHGAVDLEVPVDIQNLKLEKLGFFLSNFSNASSFLYMILSAPCLKSVVFDRTGLSNQNIATLTTLLAAKLVLQNVTQFEYYFNVSSSHESNLKDKENIFKNIVAFCPKLQRARYSRVARNGNVPEFCVPFLNLLKKI